MSILKGESRNMYKGPMGKDKGGRGVRIESRRWGIVGQGRVMGKMGRTVSEHQKIKNKNVLVKMLHFP